MIRDEYKIVINPHKNQKHRNIFLVKLLGICGLVLPVHATTRLPLPCGVCECLHADSSPWISVSDRHKPLAREDLCQTLEIDWFESLSLSQDPDAMFLGFYLSGVCVVLQKECYAFRIIIIIMTSSHHAESAQKAKSKTSATSIGRAPQISHSCHLQPHAGKAKVWNKEFQQPQKPTPTPSD